MKLGVLLLLLSIWSTDAKDADVQYVRKELEWNKPVNLEDFGGPHIEIFIRAREMTYIAAQIADYTRMVSIPKTNISSVDVDNFNNTATVYGSNYLDVEPTRTMEKVQKDNGIALPGSNSMMYLIYKEQDTGIEVYFLDEIAHQNHDWVVIGVPERPTPPNLPPIATPAPLPLPPAVEEDGLESVSRSPFGNDDDLFKSQYAGGEVVKNVVRSINPGVRDWEDDYNNTDGKPGYMPNPIDTRTDEGKNSVFTNIVFCGLSADQKTMVYRHLTGGGDLKKDLAEQRRTRDAQVSTAQKAIQDLIVKGTIRIDPKTNQLQTFSDVPGAAGKRDWIPASGFLIEEYNLCNGANAQATLKENRPIPAELISWYIVLQKERKALDTSDSKAVARFNRHAKGYHEAVKSGLQN